MGHGVDRISDQVAQDLPYLTIKTCEGSSRAITSLDLHPSVRDPALVERQGCISDASGRNCDPSRRLPVKLQCLVSNCGHATQPASRTVFSDHVSSPNELLIRPLTISKTYSGPLSTAKNAGACSKRSARRTISRCIATSRRRWLWSLCKPPSFRRSGRERYIRDCTRTWLRNGQHGVSLSPEVEVVLTLTFDKCRRFDLFAFLRLLRSIHWSRWVDL